MSDKEKAAIAEALKKAGAKPPLEVDAATLQSYVGRYKPEQGGEITITCQRRQIVRETAEQSSPDRDDGGRQNNFSSSRFWRTRDYFYGGR